MDIVPRFWNKVDKSGDCWLWLAGRNPSGYGQLAISVSSSTKRKIVQAHRVAYELTYGTIPTGLIICHRCNNRQCVNPAHLYAGTPQDNANDRVNSGKPRKERTMNIPQTINLGKVNSYIVQKTIGGYVVVFLNEDRSTRPIDGSKVHKSRQNAYAKAKRLNDDLTPEMIREYTMKAVVLSENTPRGNPSANARWGGSQDGTEMATWMHDGQWYGCLQGIYQGNWFEGEDQGPFNSREEAEASLREDYAESQQPQQDIYPSEIE